MPKKQEEDHSGEENMREYSPKFGNIPSHGYTSATDENYMRSQSDNIAEGATSYAALRTPSWMVDNTGKTSRSKKRSAGTAKEYKGSAF